MSYLSLQTHAQIIGAPTTFPSVYANTRATFLSDLGSGWAAEHEDEYKLAFAAITAYDLKPYGQSTALTLQECLADDVLDCDNYCALAWHLYQLLAPSGAMEVAFVGWNGGAVGNHAQMFGRLPNVVPGPLHCIVDPTVGIVVCGYNYDSTVMGKVMEPQYLRQPAGVQRDPSPGYTQMIKNALMNGLYRGRDLLYYCKSYEKFVNAGSQSNWLTPQADQS